MSIIEPTNIGTQECPVEDLFEIISRRAEASTADRSRIVSLLYGSLESQLKKFYSCREMSLAVTNLQQSELWRREANRLWAEAESSPHGPHCDKGSFCGESPNCPPPNG